VATSEFIALARTVAIAEGCGDYRLPLAAGTPRRSATTPQPVAVVVDPTVRAIGWLSVRLTG
jgi:hypothetical protein